MVRVDDVYQKVLALANKEQRGYITPQEFNLFADQAQKEIFEQYFYDLNQFSRVPGNSSEYSDVVDNINEKIAIFETVGTGLSLAPNLYRLGTVTVDDREVEEVQPNELLYMNNSAISRPTNSRRVYVRTGPFAITVTPVALSVVNYTFVRLPARPTWGYVVVGTKALWDGGVNSTDFELHASEESELVYKILKFAGVSMKALDIMSAGQTQEQAQVQQEKQ